ncbi:ABC transporter substrate-binding protein [Kushneria aurantia]|uniref:ABC transporter substrate-binding protein n=1 Tax=Kushneria aurantia TaxID=504092 RepID=A0ABV6G2M5_9GAMM|nr:ABC transporter substrate-binding protein [Kushneria aurantia]
MTPSILRTLALAAALPLSAGFAAAACAADVTPPDSLVNDGQLTYGVAATFAPFEYQQDGKLVGFDIELGQLIADRMGLEVNPFNVDFKGLIPALQGKRIDIINSAMYINDERAERVDFVPYLWVGNEVIVRKGNPADVAGRGEICDHTVAVTLGGISETQARGDAERCESSGEGEVNVMTFPSAQVAAMAVRRGRADAFYDSTPGAAHLLKTLPNVYEIVGDTFEANTQLGIAVRKGDDAMKTAIQEALVQIAASGDYEALLEKYKLPHSAALLLKDD